MGFLTRRSTHTFKALITLSRLTKGVRLFGQHCGRSQTAPLDRMMIKCSRCGFLAYTVTLEVATPMTGCPISL